MADEREVEEKSEEHSMLIDPVGFISEIINNIGDQRDIIRELISNAASREVGATKVEIHVYESDKGLAITISDDGKGMNYTRDNKRPGRLDKFLNAAQGKQAGFESDEFGAKGLGSKLLYNSDEVEIETWDGGKNWYRIVIVEPHKSIFEEKKLPIPKVHTIPISNYPDKKKGTSITIKGWEKIPAINKYFKLDRLKRYLRYNTVIGYTRLESRDKPLPEFILQVSGQRATLKSGFPFIPFDEKTKEERRIIFGPLEFKKTTLSGKTVRGVVKGGITLDTGVEHLGEFNLSDDTGGVWISVNGIPYFRLSTNKYTRRLNISDDFSRFVVECDDINLNLSRSDFKYDEKYEALEDGLNEVFDKIKADVRFQRFDQFRRKESKKLTQEKMNKKKEEFASEDKKFVWHDGKMLLAEPESEYDTAALLWILEGLKIDDKGAIPFFKFKTLQYAGYIEGIDMLISYQEEDDREEHICVYVELEKLFSNFNRHKHDLGQMSLAICWKVDKANIGTIKPTSKPYKHIYSSGDSTIPVFEISKFPGIFIGTKREAKEHFENK